MILQTLGLLGLCQGFLQGSNGLVDIRTVGIRHADAHVSEADVLGGNLLVQTRCKDDAALQQTRQDVRRSQTLGQPDGRHGVSLVLGLGSDLLQTELGDSSLDAVGGLGVDGVALRHGAGGDLGEGGVQGVDELGGRGGEVGGLEVLIVLHDGEPVGDGGVVGGRGRLAGLEGVDGTAGQHQDAEAGRAANGLLTGRKDDVNVPFVKSDLFAADTADTVDDDQGLGADTADDLGHALDVAEDTSRGVDVGDGDDLVGLLLKGLLNLLERGAFADGGLELGGIGTIGFQAGSEGVGEVTGVQNQGILTLLDQVGGHDIPAESTTTGDDERLSSRVGGLEEFPDHGQGLSEGLDETGGDMALTGSQEIGQ